MNNNGVITMGSSLGTSTPRIPQTTSIVSPYGAAIDTSNVGGVYYTRLSDTDPQLGEVSQFIEEETGDSFTGTRMMVAE